MASSSDSKDSGRDDRGRPDAIDSREGLLDPYPWYEPYIDTDQKVHYDNDRDTFMVFHHDAVEKVFTHNRIVSGGGNLAPEDSKFNPINSWFVLKNPPEHTRLRRSVEQHFKPDYLEEHFAPRVEELSKQLLDDALENEGTEFDFVQDYAVRIPTAIIADMIGIPRGDWTQFRHWTQMLVRRDEEVVKYGGVSEEKRLEALLEWTEYFRGFLADRRESPKDDLITQLITYEDRDGNELTDDEIIGILQLLNTGGNLTTVALMSNVIRSMAEACYMEDALEGKLDLRNTIEETLRFRPSLQRSGRTAAEDVELYGELIPENASVETWIGAANRDPRLFDDPDTFDPDRENAWQHLAFAAGRHHCLGAPLARLEVETAMRDFFGRFDEVEPNLMEVEPQPTFSEYGFTTMPVSVVY